MKANIEECIKKYELSDEAFEKQVDRYFNFLAMNVQKPEKPRLVLVGGQAGAGKTGLVATKNAELEGGAIIIDQDEIRASFPEELYKEITENYTDREEYLILKPYVLKMRQALVDRARENKYNVIMETALQVVHTFVPQIQDFKDAGYTSELSVISVPEVDCFLSTLNRYTYYLEKTGTCRRNTKTEPEMYIKLRKSLEEYQRIGIFENIEMYIRGENIHKPYRKIYSQKENPEETPIQAFDRGQKMAFDLTRRNFKERSEKTREILKKFGETDKLEQLSKIEETFDRLDDRRDSFEEL